MTEEKMRKTFFVLFTSILLAAALGILKIAGMDIKKASLLFVAAIIGTGIYIMESEEEPVKKWILAAICGFVVALLVYERTSLTPNLYMALFFAFFIAIPPVLIKIRDKLFASREIN